MHDASSIILLAGCQGDCQSACVSEGRFAQAKPNEPGTKQLPRQLQKQAYNEALIKRYKHLPEVRRIERHRHIPKPLYKVIPCCSPAAMKQQQQDMLHSAWYSGRHICKSACRVQATGMTVAPAGWIAAALTHSEHAGYQATPDHEGCTDTQAGEAHSAQQARLRSHQASPQSTHCSGAGVGLTCSHVCCTASAVVAAMCP